MTTPTSSTEKNCIGCDIVGPANKINVLEKKSQTCIQHTCGLFLQLQKNQLKYPSTTQL
jgi:hypothetical protein